MMRNTRNIVGSITVLALILSAGAATAKQNGTPYCGHTDLSKYFEHEKAHGGKSIFLMDMIPRELFETDFLWIHRGVIPPKASIGLHLQRNMEDMFFSFNLPAEFTVNDCTSYLPARSCVLCPEGSYHGIYNPHDEPIQWMNIGIGADEPPIIIDLGDDLTDREITSPPTFKWGQLDRSLLRPIPSAHLGKGAILNNKVWLDDNFKTDWMRIGHCLLPPDTSIGYHQHLATEEVYYVLEGHGYMTVNDHTWEVGPGDAIPCTLNDSHGIYNHTGGDLEIFVLIIAMEKGGLSGNYNADMEDEYRAFEVKNWDDNLADRKPSE